MTADCQNSPRETALAKMSLRDQLVDDWRRRLAEAEELQACSGRTGRYSGMQVRLYRFLLACPPLDRTLAARSQ